MRSYIFIILVNGLGRFSAFLLSVFLFNVATSQTNRIEAGLQFFYSSHELDNILSDYGLNRYQFAILHRSDRLEFSRWVAEQPNFDFERIGDDFIDFFEDKLAVNPASEKDSNPFMQHYFQQSRIPNGPCENMDFETGDLTGWTLYEGRVNENPLEMENSLMVNPGGLHHKIMGIGTDGVVGIPTVSPDGGDFSLRLGDATGGGKKAASIVQTFLVDSSNAMFTYSYAVVLEDPNDHSMGEKPFFKVNMYDDKDSLIDCGEYEVVANANLDGGWTEYDDGWYHDWTTVFAPLHKYIGSNVTIEFITGDCSKGAHYGYAYVDAKCWPLEIIPPGTMVCSNNPIELSAPPGAESYLWNNGETTQSIWTNVSGTYSVDVTPYQGGQCAVNMKGTIYAGPITPDADFDVVPSSFCLGQIIDGTDLSIVSSGDTINYWQWNFGDQSASKTTKNIQHKYDVAGQYDIQFVAGIVVPGYGGCYDTVIKSVDVAANPVANFASSVVCQGTTTQFTDQSVSNGQPITSWEWDFTSNGTVNDSVQNPTFGYPNSGSFSATLIVKNQGGCTDSVTKPVYINPVPVADFSSKDVCIGDITSFTDQSNVASGTVASHSWDFGDNVGTSTASAPTYTYGSAGTFQVSLTVTSDSGCINSVVHPVHVASLPVANFEYDSICEGTLTRFRDKSNTTTSTIISWAWDFDGDLVTDNFNPNCEHMFSSFGAYNVHLKVTNQGNCSDDTTIPVLVHSLPIANFDATPVCVNTPVQFTNQATVSSATIDSVFWDFSNGSISDLADPIESFSTHGIYNIQLTVRSIFGCEADTTIPLEVYPLPQPDFHAEEVCDGDTVLFQNHSTVENYPTTNIVDNLHWEFGDGNVLTTSNSDVNYRYAQAGSYIAQLTAQTDRGCVDSIEKTVVINPNPVPMFVSPNPKGCATWCPEFENQSTIATGSIVSYLWDMGDGTNYTIYDTTHCYENESVSIAKFDVGLSVTSDKGCTADTLESGFITVYPSPIANFDATPWRTDVYNTKIYFRDESTLGDKLNWNFGILGVDSIAEPSFTFPETDAANYDVCLTVTSDYGCQDKVCQPIIVEGYSTIFVPNTFTPNHDQINDKFIPVLLGISREGYSFRVFDRWGLLLYSTNRLEGAWDGTYGGFPALVDSYVWKVQARSAYTGKIYNRIGHVNLLR